MAKASKKQTKVENPEVNTTKGETYEFGAETGKILQLVIHSLYANKEIFLRELISNASDALDKFRYNNVISESSTKKDEDSTDSDEQDSELKIKININEKAQTLTIEDNGVGMTKEELIQNLGTIASSGTQRFLEAAAGNKKADISLIGQFGVGFYSSFMVADKVTVISKSQNSKDVWLWSSNADGKYNISKSDQKLKQGTVITLHIKDDCKEFLDRYRISHVVKTYSDHIPFKVELTADDKTETLNNGQALWAKPKASITKEQYTEFYKHIAHAGDEPWIVLHNKAEGTIEYTNLLFIPSVKPFDLFHPDRSTRVRLYVKKVFISEQNIDVVPRYLRFLRGIVDSLDLPLNISRETLQHNNVLKKINSSITKRVLNELKDKAKNAPEEFAKFWDNFGAVLKEGLCEGIDANREQLMEACHFKTSKSGDKIVSLDTYIENMKPEQKHIYYLSGDNLAALKNNPKLENFIKQDIEVILLTDSVDDFWTTVTHEYKGKELISINRADAATDLEQDTKDDNKEEDSSTDKENQEEIVKLFRETLSGKIMDAVISKKLADSPVCLSVREGAMDMRMERFLLSQNQLNSASLKILEINPKHPIIKNILKNPSDSRSKTIIELLFDEACILEGETIANPGDFAKRLNQLLELPL